MDTQKNNKQKRFFKATPLALALIFSGYSAATSAAEFSWGDFEGTFNSQISAGSSWRVGDPDGKNIAPGNGGVAENTGTADDGNLNYKSGDAFTQTIKGIHDLSIEKDNYGVFVRGKYWYDYALDNHDLRHGAATSDYVQNKPMNDDDLNDLNKAKGVELLDAYIYAGFDIGEMVVDLRVGKQVVNWGESSFIQGGINAVNPVDAAAFRRPGAEVKEGLLPVNMIFANIGVTDNLSIEAFYQLEFKETVIDACGSYFSQADYLAEGCDKLVIDPTSGLMTDQEAHNGKPEWATPGHPLENFSKGGLYAERGTDEDASDSGQFGIAFKYYAEELNATEFGLYYINYHSRLPYASAEAGLFNDGTGSVPFIPVGSPSLGPTLPSTAYNPRYHTVYPEDIQLFGLSFNTTVSEWAIAGEVSHRLDLPLQINGSDLLSSALSNAGGSPTTPYYQGFKGGETVDGFNRFDYTQSQITFIKFFDQALGTDRITFVSELGYGHVWDLDESDGAVKYGRSTTFGVSYDGKGDDDDGFTTSDSAGYRLAVKADYRNVFSGVDLSPTVAWSHDVYGYSPEPQATFQEGRTGLNVGLRADYLQTYNMSMSYTQFGGKFNPLSDRDYVSVSFGVAF